MYLLEQGSLLQITMMLLKDLCLLEKFSFLCVIFYDELYLAQCKR